MTTLSNDVLKTLYGLLLDAQMMAVSDNEPDKAEKLQALLDAENAINAAATPFTLELEYTRQDGKEWSVCGKDEATHISLYRRLTLATHIADWKIDGQDLTPDNN